ncbi:hypothetical protein [Methyloglobulus sp.]|uniref:DUF7230 family protein n=1 Tax=Methyloglobulus sp. TaxID=2518622 RepID=UPI0018344BDE|nr:hypothetical protein [Methyloglobulus sp.]
MKKRKNMNKIEDITSQNPVAKFAHLFNKSQIFSDKSKYIRKAKHAKQEASLFILTRMNREVFC